MTSKRMRSLFSFRRVLTQIHRDLIKIDHCVLGYAEYYPDKLTELEKLVITLEDRKFFSHKGVHVKAIFRELFRAITFRRPHGASTIDMQFVRTATGLTQRTLKRKLYEMLLANLIQYRYSKLTILRSYLSIAYLGWELRGMPDASQENFKIYYDDIEGLDAAKLASYLVFPKPKYPNSQWEKRVLRRANYINSIYVSGKKRFKKIESRIFI